MTDVVTTPSQRVIVVDIIVPVHNASETLEETIGSAMTQVIPPHLIQFFKDQLGVELDICVCCYDDGSTDSSWESLCRLEKKYRNRGTMKDTDESQRAMVIASRLLIGKSSDSIGRGAGYARNRAASMREKIKRDNEPCNNGIGNVDDNNKNPVERFLCLLDSDDVMHETRVAEQCSTLMALPKELRQRMLLGCKIVRDPPDSTWHYSQWANSLTDERIHLERFREVTILQPTWMLCRSRFDELKGYIEAPLRSEALLKNLNNKSLRLIHPTFDTPETLRFAEDLRFFHAHLHANGVLQLHRSTVDPNRPLVTYRHRANQSQSSQTSRKLLVHLRALAFEKCVLLNDSSTMDAWSSTNAHNGKFVIWGQGRDGKELVRALSAESRKRIYCFVDVDFKKIQQGYYCNKDLQLKIPIVHFSLLAKQPELRQQLLQEKTAFGRIDKCNPRYQVHDGDVPKPSKRLKENHRDKLVAMAPTVAASLDTSVLPELPVVVCVAMYRTNGALEENVKRIGRQEGVDLWHFN